MSLDPLRLGEHIAQALAGRCDRSAAHVWSSSHSTVAVGELPRCVQFLRDDPECDFRMLMDVCGVDWPKRERRFDVVYHFLSLTQNQRVRLKVETDEQTPVPSIAAYSPRANWFEREDVRHVRHRVFAITPICAAFSPITASRVFRCARISRSPALSSCATMTNEAGRLPARATCAGIP